MAGVCPHGSPESFTGNTARNTENRKMSPWLGEKGRQQLGADSLMRSSVAGSLNACRDPLLNLLESPPTGSEPHGRTCFVPCCFSETEEVIYVLFGYGSLVWRIGSRQREFFFFFLSHTLSPSAPTDWPYDITHSITHCRKYCWERAKR